PAGVVRGHRRLPLRALARHPRRHLALRPDPDRPCRRAGEVGRAPAARDGRGGRNLRIREQSLRRPLAGDGERAEAPAGLSGGRPQDVLAPKRAVRRNRRMTEAHYIHGTDPDEQKRLSRLNDLINRRSLAALALEGGERVLDVGSGLGQLSRAMALAAGPQGRVIGVERSREQLTRAQELAHAAGEGTLVDFRLGDAAGPPLRDEGGGTFEVPPTPFPLE